MKSGNAETGRAFLGSYVRSYKEKRVVTFSECRKISYKDKVNTILTSSSPMYAFLSPFSWTGKREYPL